MAETIDGVIEELDAAIQWARENDSRLGYFPALYRKVTVAVRDGIRDNYFDDGERMARLDVIFANRYLDAFYAFRRGGRLTAAWQAAFDSAGQWRPIVLQHLLLGINAHINLDLGIAAAAIAPGEALPELRDDFNRINQILADLVAEVQASLTQVWPALRALTWGRSDDAIVNFSMERARESAWRVAEDLAALPSEQHAAYIAKLDRQVENRAHILERPGVLLSSILLGVRIRERGSVAEIIDLFG